MKPSELLLEARDAVAAGWCQRSLAVTADGATCAPYDPDARAWCMEGAMDRMNVADVSTRMRAYRYLQAVMPNVAKTAGVEFVNDDPDVSQADVVGWFDSAAREAKAVGE